MPVFDCLSVGVAVADAICEPVRRLPGPGELELTPRISLAIGGCAANVAVDLARLGARSAIVGGIGQDAFGQYLATALQAEGVDVGNLRFLPGQATSATLVVNVGGEDRRFIHAAGANAVLDGSEISDDLLRSARVLYVGGFCLMPRLTGERLAVLFRRARSLGVRTLLDVVVSDPAGWADHLRAALPETDVFLPNSDEGRMLTGLSNPVEQAELFRTWGAGTAVVTCGAAGAVLIAPRTRLKSGVFPVEFVDGTGSGDAFDAGYIDGLLRGLSPAECLARGSALGASCVRRAGATTGVFTRDELEAFLKSNPLRIESLE